MNGGQASYDKPRSSTKPLALFLKPVLAFRRHLNSSSPPHGPNGSAVEVCLFKDGSELNRCAAGFSDSRKSDIPPETADIRISVPACWWKTNSQKVEVALDFCLWQEAARRKCIATGRFQNGSSVLTTRAYVRHTWSDSTWHNDINTSFINLYFT